MVDGQMREYMWFNDNSKGNKDLTPDDRLWQAIKTNSPADLTALLSTERPDVNAKRQGTTPLIAALRVECPDEVPANQSIVQLLINAGADVDEPSGNLCTPLTTALLLDRPVDATRLLFANADPNGAELGGRLPLHIAIARNQTQCVRVLLDHGADVKAKGTEGRDGLDYSRSFGGGRKTEIQTLLEAAEARYEQDLPGILQKAFERGTSRRFRASKRLSLKAPIPPAPR